MIFCYHVYKCLTCPLYDSITDHQIKNRWLVAYTLIRNPSLIPLTATNWQQTQSAKSIDHASSAHDNGSNLLHSNSIPCTYNDSKNTADSSLGVTADDSGIEPMPKTTIDCQITERHRELENETDIEFLTRNDADSAKLDESCEPKLELKVETDQSASNGSKSGLTASESMEQNKS